MPVVRQYYVTVNWKYAGMTRYFHQFECYSIEWICLITRIHILITNKSKIMKKEKFYEAPVAEIMCLVTEGQVFASSATGEGDVDDLEMEAW